MRVCRWQSPTLWRAGPPPYAKGLHQFSYWHPVVLKMDDLEERSLCLKLSSREKQNFLHWMPVDLFFALASKFLAGDSGFSTNAPSLNSAGLWFPSEVPLRSASSLSVLVCGWGFQEVWPCNLSSYSQPLPAPVFADNKVRVKPEEMRMEPISRRQRPLQDHLPPARPPTLNMSKQLTPLALDPLLLLNYQIALAGT